MKAVMCARRFRRPRVGCDDARHNDRGVRDSRRHRLRHEGEASRRDGRAPHSHRAAARDPGRQARGDRPPAGERRRATLTRASVVLVGSLHPDERLEGDHVARRQVAEIAPHRSLSLPSTLRRWRFSRRRLRRARRVREHRNDSASKRGTEAALRRPYAELAAAEIRPLDAGYIGLRARFAYRA
jgi:hypothetical protein